MLNTSTLRILFPIISSLLLLVCAVFLTNSVAAVSVGKNEIQKFTNSDSNISVSIYDQNVTQISKRMDEHDKTNPVVVIIAKGSTNPKNSKFYLPQEYNIAVNGTGAWFNNDTVAHTVTSSYAQKQSAQYFESGLIYPDSPYRHIFRDPEIYDYYCSLHPYMTGRAIVGYYTYNLNANNQSYAISYLITGDGNEISRISSQTNSSILDVRITAKTPGNLTLIIPRNLLDNREQNGKDDPFTVIGNRPAGFFPSVTESSSTNYSRTLKIQFDKSVSQIQISGTKKHTSL